MVGKLETIVAVSNTSNHERVKGEDLLAEEQDYGYEIGGGSEDEEGLDECEGDAADLGAEDGEKPWDVDHLHAEGYDELLLLKLEY